MMTKESLARIERAIEDRDVVAVMAAASGLVAAVRKLSSCNGELLGRCHALTVAEPTSEAHYDAVMSWRAHVDSTEEAERKRNEAEAQLTVCNQARDALAKRANMFLAQRNEAEALCLALYDESESETWTGILYECGNWREKLAAMRERAK